MSVERSQQWCDTVRKDAVRNDALWNTVTSDLTLS